jgi:hypothetical protein
MKTNLTQEVVRKAITVCEQLLEQGWDYLPEINVNGNKWESVYVYEDGFAYGLCSIIFKLRCNIYGDEYFNSFAPKNAEAYWFPIIGKKHLKARLKILRVILKDMQKRKIK